MVKRFIDPKEQFKILIDTREKHKWVFPVDEYCIGSEVKCLKTADYSIAGCETEIVVEKKSGTSELAINIYEPRFEEEFKRLEEFTHPYMICECTYADVVNFPIGSQTPKRLWHHLKVRGEHLEKALIRYSLKYKTKIIFAGKFGDRVCYKLFKYFMRMKMGKL